jgi:hypothetical protein
MTKTTERNWTEPIGELSMAWAQEIAKQFEAEVTVEPYTTLVLPPDRHGAMITFTVNREKDSKKVTILTNVQVCVQPWDDRREVRIQVYSPTGQGTGGVDTRWVTGAADGSSELEAVWEEIGTWAWEKRLEVADQI